MQTSVKAMARMVDRSTRCMRCNQLGHALCEGDGKESKSEGGEIHSKQAEDM